MKFMQLLFLYMQGLITVTSNSEEITSVAGRIAILPCPASSSSSKQPTLLRWFHSGHHKPLYTLDVRQSRWPDGGRHFPSPDAEGRLFVESGALRLDPVVEGDAGSYLCRVDFRGERSAWSAVELDVVVPPKLVTIRDKNEKQVQSIVGPFSLGEKIILTCESSGGKPSPKLKWTSSISDKSFEVISKENSSSIIISHLSRDHQWSHFTCAATNSRLVVPKSFTVTIELNLPPLEVKISSATKEPFKTGQTVSLACQSIGSHPRAHLRWYMEGNVLDSREIINNNGNVTISYLKRRIDKLDNGKFFECIATNPNIPNYVMKKTYYMQVLYPPEVEIMVFGNPTDWITAGSNITLHCITEASPNTCKITWFFNGEEIKNSTGNRCLKLQNIKRSQTGTYVCQAENTQGKSSSSVYMDVKYPPICHRLSATPTLDNATANVTCNLLSNPPANVTLRWTPDGGGARRTWGGHAALVPRGGSVLCWGENEVGRQMEPCVLGLPLRAAKQGSSLNKKAFIITGIGLIFCIFGILIVIKKYQNTIKETSVDCEEFKSFTDRGCSSMINNCVKSSNNVTDIECMTTLLNSHQKTALQLTENRQTIYGKSSASNIVQPRRVRSTQF